MKEPLKNIEFSTKPNEKELRDIQSWCEPYNYVDAESAYKRKKLFVILYQGNAIAFMCYRREKIIATIDFAEVHPKLRDRQVGGYLLECALRHFKRTHIKGVELYCTSPDSHRHAARHGFSPITKEYSKKDWMFRPLAEPRKLCLKSGRMLVVWKNTMGSCSDKPDLCWPLDKELNKPIISYCHYDWMVGIVENGHIVRADKQKRFFKEEIYDYIYIDNNKHQI